MNPSENKQNKRLSPWIIGTLSLISFAAAVVVSLYITFSLDQFTDKQDNASAFILCFISSMALVMLAYASRTRKISLLPAILGGLLMVFGLMLLVEVLYGNYFEGFRNSNPVTWEFYAALFYSPVFASAIYEMRTTGQTVAWRVAAIICVVLPLLLLVTVAIPIKNQAAHRAVERDKEMSENTRRSTDLRREQNELSEEQSRTASGLKSAAFKTVQNISQLAGQTGTLPASVPTPEGYEFTEYTVQDKYKVRFCMRPEGALSYNIGGVVDWSVRTGAMYWLSDIIGGNQCSYKNINLMKLSE